MNTFPAGKRINTCRKILVVKPSSLGDIVHSLPFLNSLKACYPRAEIHWVIAKGLEGLLECHPMVDKLIVINKDMWKKLSRTKDTIKEVTQLLKNIRNEQYDLVADLQGLFRSGIITMATRAPVRVGFSEAREGSRLFYNIKVKGGRDVHAVERYMKIAGALGCDEKNILFPFALCDSKGKTIEEIRSSIKEYAVIVPGARWATKIWPAENFGRIASLLSVQALVIGSKDDIPIAERVVQSSGGKAVSLAGKTSLKELIEVMRHARVVISNDSGPLHIAAGFQVPVVAVFGPTSPQRTGPYGAGNIVIQSDASCAPCFRKKCRDMRCMTGITVELVFEKMRNISGIT